MPDKEPAYHIPNGYSSFQVMMRAIRMARSPIVEVGEEHEEIGGTYSAIFPGDLR